MALKIYDTLAPQGDYPAVNAADILMPDGTRLDAWKPVNMTEAAIFPELDLTGFTPIAAGGYVAVQGGVLFTLTAGTEYRVSYDGDDYAVTAADVVTEDGVTITGLGNAALTGDYENTGEPFYIYAYAASSVTVFAAETDGPHTVAIWQTVEAPMLPGIAGGDEGKILSVLGGTPAWIDMETSAVPTFDLAALGLGAVDLTGTESALETDTTAILAALDKGAVKFVIPTTGDGGATIDELTVIMTAARVADVCICSYAMPFGTDIFQVVIWLEAGGLLVWIMPYTTFLKEYMDAYMEEALGGEY